METEYTKVIEEIEARGVFPKTRPSLEPTRLALKKLGLLDAIDPKQVILVAGTNGKGSTAKTLETLLRCSGKSTGLFTSPHLMDTCERIQFNGENVSHEVFLEAFREIDPIAKELKLSHFELLTVMAARIFNRSGNTADWQIYEVGLGGTWDSTNAIPHELCVIAPIHYDHEHILGRTLGEIAGNKFGIVPGARKVVHIPFSGEVEEVRKQVALENTLVEWTPCSPYDYSVEKNEQTPRYYIHTPWGKNAIQLLGERGAQNTALALTAFKAFAEEDPNLENLEKVFWPGRLEEFRYKGRSARVLLSGDHNPSGVQSLIRLLGDYSYDKVSLLVGVGKNKNANGIIEPLLGIPRSELYLTRTPFQGLELSEYGSWLSKAKEFWEDPMEAIDVLSSHSLPKQLILVTGSLYLVGSVRKHLLNEEGFI